MTTVINQQFQNKNIPYTLINTTVAIRANNNYILLEDGNYELPTNVFPGDSLTLIASPQNQGDAITISLPNSGFLFSAPGQLPYPLRLPDYTLISLFNVGGDNWSLIKNFQSRFIFADQTANGVLGDSGTLLANIWIINQTTPGIQLTLPSGLSPLSTFDVTIINTGTEPVEIESINIPISSARRFIFEGTQWLILS